MTRRGCPSDDELRAFHQGELPEPTLEAIAHHLEGCTSCEDRARALDEAPDALAASLRRHLGSATPSAAPPSPEKTEPVADANAAPPRFDFLSPPEGPGELGWLGHFRIVKLLGRGGMGMVFQADDTHLLRTIALKLMRPERAADPGARLRFLREARAAARLRHDHIVTIFQVGQEKDVPFLAMELLPGMALEHRLEQSPPLSVAEAVRIGREMAAGLEAAHAAGLIHRDIKPANIWLEAGAGLPPPGRVKILDFGLARLEQDGMRLTESGLVVGTPAYMAPEQARGDSVDPRSDLFSLGCVLYQMVTGRPPFRGSHTMALLTALALDQPTPPHELAPAVPRALSDLILRLLAKDPAQRPSNARAVADALYAIEPLTAGVGASALQRVQPRPSSTSVIAAPRRRWRPVAALVVFGVALSLGLWSLVSGGGGTPSSQAARPTTPEALPVPGPNRPAELVRVLGEPRPRHRERVKALAFDPDAGVLAAASGNVVYLWDLKTRTVRATLTGHADEVVQITFAPDGTTIASGSRDGQVRLWDAATGQRRAEFQGTTIASQPGTFAYDGVVLVGADKDGNILVWDAADGQKKASWKGHTVAAVRFLALTPDGTKLVSGAFNGEIKTWDMATHKEGRVLQGQIDNLRQLAVSNDGGRVAALIGAELRVWNAATGRRDATIPAGDTQEGPLLFTPDGQRLLACAGNGLRITPIADPAKQTLLESPSGVVNALALSGAGRTVAAGTYVDGQVRLWDLTTAKPLPPLGDQPVEINAMATLGPVLATAGSEGVLLYDRTNWQSRGALPKDDFRALALGPKLLAAQAFAPHIDPAQVESTVWLRGLPDGPARPMKLGTGFAPVLALAPDAHTVAVAHGKVVELWDVTEAGLRRPLPGHTDAVLSLAFAPDGKQLASGSRDCSVRVFDPTTGKETAGPFQHASAVSALAWTPDGGRVATATAGGVLSLWTVPGGVQDVLLRQPRAPFTSVAVSADGRSLAAATALGRVVVLDLPGARLRHDWHLPGPVYQVAFTTDNQYLATVNGDGTAFVLRLAAPPPSDPRRAGASAVARSPDSATRLARRSP